MAVYTVSITDGTSLAGLGVTGTSTVTLSVAAGRGPKGDGWTGVTFDANNNTFTFTSNDGLGYVTDPVTVSTEVSTDTTPQLGGDLDLNTQDIIGTGNIDTTGHLDISGNATIGGNLTVNGTTTTINTQTLDVEDKNITVAFGAIDGASADGAGLTVDGANATLTYVNTGDKWSFNKTLDVTGNITLTGTVDGRDVAADGALAASALQDVSDDTTPTLGGTLDADGNDITNAGTITAAQYDSTEALPDIKPSLNLDFANVKRLDPRITYTRASTGTYYDGKTFAKAEENLLLQSQDFTTTWVNSGSTDSGDTETAPDGTTTADTITATAATGQHYVQQLVTIANGTYVFSVFAKAGTNDYIQLAFGGDADYANFDLATGVVGTTSGVVSSSITASTNGFYRCEVVTTLTSATAAVIAMTDSSSATRLNTWTALGTETVHLWGAQLEQRSALTDYTPTTTQPITNYIPALQTAASGEARFDHDPITNDSLGFLIEEQRTNLVERSEEFDNAYWTKSDTSITSNTIVAPDGTLTGDKFIADATAANHVLSRAVTVVASTAYTWSCYVKAAEYSYLGVEFYGSGGLNNTFDLINGTVSVGTPYDSGTNPSGSITPVGNGWYRVTLGITTKAGDTSAFVQLRLYEDNTYTASFTGDGYSGVYIWGAQLEAGAFPTSYIKTTTAQATRNADAASMTGTNFSEWYRQDEGTLFANFDSLTVNNSSFNRVLEAAADANNRQSLLFNTNASPNRLYVSVLTNGASQANLESPNVFDVTISEIKGAFAYAADDFVRSFDGGPITSDTSGIVPRVDTLFIGYEDAGTRQLNGHIRKLAYYPQRLSNATLQALTEE